MLTTPTESKNLMNQIIKQSYLIDQSSNLLTIHIPDATDRAIKDAITTANLKPGHHDSFNIQVQQDGYTITLRIVVTTGLCKK